MVTLPPPLEPLRLLADVQQVEVIGARAEIQVHIDVDVEFARHFENAIDLAVRVGVRIGRCADHLAASFQGRDHQLIGAWVIEQSLLRKDADLHIDRPGILLDQRPHALEPSEADAGIDLELRAHMCRAVEDAALERPLAALVDVLRREGRLRLGHFLDGFFEVSFVGAAAIENVRLVEMDVRLDETGRHEPAADIDRFAFSGEVRDNGGDPARLNADVDEPAFGSEGSAVSQYQVHRCAPSP